MSQPPYDESGAGHEAPQPGAPQPGAPRYEAPPSNAPRYAAPPPHAPGYAAPPPHAPGYAGAPQYAAPQAPQAPQAPPYGAPPAPSYAQPAAQPGGPHQPGSPYQRWQQTGAQFPGPGGLFDGATHAGDLNRPLYGASIGQAFSRFFRNYANFSGRASRSEFWWMALVFWGAVFALAIMAGLATEATSFGPARGLGEGIAALFGLVVLALFFGSVVPWLAISWRRLHDANLPGPLWFINLAPYLGSLALLILLILPPKPEGRRFDAFTR